MLHSISWQSYLITLLFVAIAYYVFIGIRFYSRENLDFLKSQFKSRKHFPAAFSSLPQSEIKSDSPPAESHQLEMDFADTTEDIFKQVEELIEKIKAAIQKASKDLPDKDPFIDSLRQIMSQYSDLKGTHFQAAITELIENECENSGFLHLKEEDINRLW